MIQRFATGIFTRDYKKTIGVDFLEKEGMHFEKFVLLLRLNVQSTDCIWHL